MYTSQRRGEGRNIHNGASLTRREQGPCRRALLSWQNTEGPWHRLGSPAGLLWELEHFSDMC